ncbi:MAG: cyclopentanol dehydrogenase [Tagaea sp. CACIAM 22H2]|nr:cyclopentanol dehydrogenase [Tagaea sp. CACIAM 22H2]
MTGLLAGKTAIVAGADGALGAAIVAAFLTHGANVVAGGAYTGEKSSRLRAGALDPRDPDSWARLVDLAIAEFGGLTTLVNTAPDPGRAGVEQTSEAEWDGTIDADLRGAWLGMKAAIPAIRKSGGGAVINTSSTAAMVGSGHSAAYHGAMAGVLMLTRTASIEYAKQGIRINAVLPGPVDPSLAAGLDAAAQTRFLQLTPMKRLGGADEIAGAYVFLASDLATFVTGTGLVVDGGYTAA